MLMIYILVWDIHLAWEVLCLIHLTKMGICFMLETEVSVCNYSVTAIQMQICFGIDIEQTMFGVVGLV